MATKKRTTRSTAVGRRRIRRPGQPIVGRARTRWGHVQDRALPDDIQGGRRGGWYQPPGIAERVAHSARDRLQGSGRHAGTESRAPMQLCFPRSTLHC